MKIETQPLEGHQVQLTVEIEPSLLEEAKVRAAKKIARKVKVPGFRPGKAPYAVVLRFAGEEAIAEEAIEILVEDVYPKIIEESGIEPYGPGSLKDIKSMEPPVFEFVVPLKATVELGDYASVQLPYELEPVPDTRVEEVLSRLREQQAVIETVERPAGETDLVVVKLDAERLDSAEEKAFIEDRTVTIDIKSEEADSTGEWPFPGFSRKLLGLKAGDQQSFEYQYPEDYIQESQRGANVRFEVQVNEVKSRTLPELNDEFAQAVGEFAALEDLRSAILKDVETHERSEYNDEYDEKVMDGVIELSSIKFPTQMLDSEVEDVIRSLDSRLKRQGMDLELYLKTRGMDMEALKAETRPIAEKRLKRTLVLLELAEKENIRVDQEELQLETSRTLEQFARVMPEKDFKKLTARDGTTNLVGNIMMEMVITKTTDRLRSIAQGIVPEITEAEMQELEQTEEMPESEQAEGGGETPALPDPPAAAPAETE